MNYEQARAEHYRRIRTDPIYRLQEQLEDMRVEMMPALEVQDFPEKTILPEPEWTKRQWNIINQLRGMVQFLYSKETERRANASKRRPKSKY